MTNAALWFGTVAFLTFAVWPAFYSSEMLAIPLPRSHAGAAALVVLDRYYIVQYWCAGIALGHLLLEWLYAGKPLRRGILYLVVGVLGLSLFTGLLVQPKLKQLHVEIYGVRSTPQQRDHARRRFPAWKGVVQVSNLLVLAGLWVYVWQVNNPSTSARFVHASKLRGLTNGVT